MANASVVGRDDDDAVSRSGSPGDEFGSELIDFVVEFAVRRRAAPAKVSAGRSGYVCAVVRRIPGSVGKSTPSSMGGFSSADQDCHVGPVDQLGMTTVDAAMVTGSKGRSWVAPVPSTGSWVWWRKLLPGSRDHCRLAAPRPRRRLVRRSRWRWSRRRCHRCGRNGDVPPSGPPCAVSP